MSASLHIGLDYTNKIVDTIMRKTGNILVFSSVFKRLKNIAIHVLVKSDYTAKKQSDTIFIERDKSKIYLVPVHGELIISEFPTKVDSLIIDDFTHIPKKVLHSVMCGYLAEPEKIDIEFYTDDIKNKELYTWLDLA